MSRRAREVMLRGPGAAAGGGTPLVSDLRTVELSLHPLLRALRERTGAVAQEALELARALEEALPEEVVGGKGGEPGLWECFVHEFARYSVAPALMNREIARAALEEAPGAGARCVERPGGAWWLGGSGAAEAAQEAAREAGRACRVTPGRRLRALRPGVALSLARRAPRAFEHCWNCEVREEEGLPEGPREVLFLGLAATSAPFIARLSAALEAEGLRCLTVDTHCEGSTGALRRAGVRVLDGRPGRWGGEAEAQRAREAARRWSAEAQAGLGRLVREGRIPAWLRGHLAVRLAVTCGRDLPAIAAFRRVAEVVAEAAQPRVVVGFHLSADFLAPFVLGARRRGVPSVWYQHGIRGPVHRHGVGLPWETMLCFGQYTRDLYGDLMFPETEWVIAGNCLYDELIREGLPEAGAARAKLGAGERRVVLAATQSDEAQVRAAQPRWWLEGLAAACREQGALLAVKLHPVEKGPELYAGLAAGFPETVRVYEAQELDLREALAGADLLATRDSTVIYEAALAGKPVLSVTLPPYLPRFPLAEHGGARAVHDYEEIGPALEELLSRGPGAAELARRRGEFLEYHLGPPDGEATRRVVERLQALAEGQA